MEMENVCDVCGNAGFSDDLVACSGCKKAAEHIYCRRIEPDFGTEAWYCFSCSLNIGRVAGSRPDTYHCAETAKDSNDEYANLVLPWDSQKKLIPRKCTFSRASVRKVKFLNDSEVSLNLGTSSCCEPQFPIPLAPTILIINQAAKSPNLYSQNYCWKGTFDLLDAKFQVFHGIQAHFPFKVSSRAYGVQRNIPQNLKLKVQSRANVWPRAFRHCYPTQEDIALYFFPSKDESTRERYFHLMDDIENEDSAMHCRIGGAELLIFTSKLLPLDNQRISEDFFFWAVFRHSKAKKLLQEKKMEFPSTPPPATQQTACCASPKTVFDEIDTKVDINDMIIPPGFSYPPVFRSRNTPF